MDWRTDAAARAHGRSMTTARDRLLLASIHDVSPRFESEVDGLPTCCALTSATGSRCWWCRTIGATRRSCPVRRSPRVCANGRRRDSRSSSTDSSTATRRGTPAAADRVRASLMTAGEGEFLGLDRSAAAAAHPRGPKPARGHHRTADRRLRRSGLALRAGRDGSAWRLLDRDRRGPSAGVVAGDRPAACARPGDHLGEPDAAAPRLLARRSGGAAPRTAQGPAGRRPSARHSSSRAGAEHRSDVAKRRQEPAGGGATRDLLAR